jgi:TolB protein
LVAVVFDPSLSSRGQIVRIAYPGGDMRRITNDLNQYSGVSLTADSRSLVSVQRDTQANLYVLPGGDSARAVPVTSSASARDGVAGIDWLPDGRIVYGGVIGGVPELFIIDADGRNPRQLTSEPASGLPAVAPDGRTIAFVSDRTEKRQIWRIDIDGGHPKQLTHGNADIRPVFTPDGGSIVFYSFVAPGREIWKVGLDGGEPVPFVSAAAQAKASLPPNLWNAQSISPDGRLLAITYWDPELNRERVAILDLEGRTAAKRLTMPPVNFVRFTPDGLSLTYVDSQGGASNVWNQPIDGGPPRQVTRFTSDRIFGFAWSRDGKRLALSRGRTRFDVVLISNLH